MTYAAPITVDCEYMRGRDKVAKSSVFVGRMPLMLRSDRCAWRACFGIHRCSQERQGPGTAHPCSPASSVTACRLCACTALPPMLGACMRQMRA